MSGGSWDYIDRKIMELAVRLENESAPMRRQMATQVYLLAQAMYDIEKVDSGDYSPGQEIPAIEKFIGTKLREDTPTLAHEPLQLGQPVTYKGQKYFVTGFDSDDRTIRLGKPQGDFCPYPEPDDIYVMPEEIELAEKIEYQWIPFNS